MTGPELRPLSLGEILDRTFSIYRENFLLFVGLASIVQIFVLVRNLLSALPDSGVVQMPAGIPSSVNTSAPVSPWLFGPLIALAIPLLIVYIAVSMYADGAMYFAVSEFHLGRKITIGAALKRMRGRALTLFGLELLRGLAMAVAFICLIIPGVYLGCRWSVCVPAVLFEEASPGEAMSRSFELTRDSAWRAFVIFVLYLLLLIVALVMFQFPFNLLASFAVKGSPMALLWTELGHVGVAVATVLVTPYLPIATAIFYYDLRVRKEAFDLHVIMNPENPTAPPSPDAPLSLA
jgi:hypothetical protein